VKSGAIALSVIRGPPAMDSVARLVTARLIPAVTVCDVTGADASIAVAANA
jgi:hypothetical protein